DSVRAWNDIRREDGFAERGVPIREINRVVECVDRHDGQHAAVFERFEAQRPATRLRSPLFTLPIACSGEILMTSLTRQAALPSRIPSWRFPTTPQPPSLRVGRRIARNFLNAGMERRVSRAGTHYALHELRRKPREARDSYENDRTAGTGPRAAIA